MGWERNLLYDVEGQWALAQENVKRDCSVEESRPIQILGGQGTSFTLVTPSSFFDAHVNFFDGVKEWSGPFLDAHQLGIRLNLTLISPQIF